MVGLVSAVQFDGPVDEIPIEDTAIFNRFPGEDLRHQRRQFPFQPGAHGRAESSFAPMQDFLGLGSEARMNTPGTTEGNWRWRLMREQINDSLCQSIREMVVASGRSA